MARPAPDAGIHPYYTAKAREIFVRAGGDPANSGPLAQWMSDHRDDTSTHGVVVADDGEILATTYVADWATYVHAGDVSRWNLVGHPTGLSLELGLALAGLRHKTGKQVIHVKRSIVCFGAGQHIQET